MKCKCLSQKTYDVCCKPFHTGKSIPKTPLELMRSRFCAYALGIAEYIIETTHPDHLDQACDEKTRLEEIKTFSTITSFDGLTILDHTDDTVTFRAHLTQEGNDVSFTELSSFEKVDGKWYYLKGKLLPFP